MHFHWLLQVTFQRTESEQLQKQASYKRMPKRAKTELQLIKYGLMEVLTRFFYLFDDGTAGVAV